MNAKISELGSRLAESDQSHNDKVLNCVKSWRDQEWMLFKDRGSHAQKWTRGLNCCLFRGNAETDRVCATPGYLYSGD